MNEDLNFTITIPADDDGYVLLKCPVCGTFFKATLFDLQDEGILELHCPSCGLASDNFITDDVLELAMVMAENAAADRIYKELKRIERQIHKESIKLLAGSPQEHEPEDPIRSGIEAMEIVIFPCCQRTAKIKPILRMTGCYCPFCGVKSYEVE